MGKIRFRFGAMQLALPKVVPQNRFSGYFTINKAFVREPEPDARAFCPNCGAVGVAVGQTTLDHHMRADSRSKLGADVWFCPSPTCDTAYFDFLERFVLVNELRHPVYPKSTVAAICPCFGFTIDDLYMSIRSRSPEHFRKILVCVRSFVDRIVTTIANHVGIFK